MERLSLEGKVAIVTGSNSGIGESIAHLFARRGARVVIHGRNAERCEKVRQDVEKSAGKQGQVTAVPGEITDKALYPKLVDAAINTFGRLDILVNNAGNAMREFVRDAKESTLDTMYATHVKAPVLLSQVALPHLIKSKGNIVNVSTELANEVKQGFFPYAIAKSAQDAFTKYAAVEYGHAGIRVNSVRPGVIETPAFKHIPDDIRKEVFQDGADCTILGRNGRAEDIAEAVAYFASPAADFITGVLMDADGGRGVYRDRSKKDQEPTYDDLVEPKA